MIDYSGLVKEFQQKHGIVVAGEPRIPNPDAVILRFRLMIEELFELTAALHERKILDVADALADLLYVIHGTANACGIPIDAVFAEVHRANMTKPRLDEHQKGGKGAGYRSPRLGPLLFPDRFWCPACGRELDVPFVRYSETAAICGCGLTREELI